MQTIHCKIGGVSPNLEESVACIGFFDGVHRGHQKLITETKRIAKEKNLKTAMITFNPSPKSVVSKSEEKLLTPVTEKINILKSTGLDYLIIINFNEETLHQDPSLFVEMMILNNNVKHIVAGPDFKFGYKGRGNPQLINEYIPVTVVEGVYNDGQLISSTEIKEHIRNGELNKASFKLGYQYFIEGYVIHGKKRGRLIGFPTANMRTKSNKIIPPSGVYAAITEINGNKYLSTINIGYNPTFKKLEQISIESFIHDFKGEVYGEEAKFIFVKKIRDEITFEGVEALVSQMEQDVLFTEKYFSEEMRKQYGIRSI